jgi:hypothetical protein
MIAAILERRIGSEWLITKKEMEMIFGVEIPEVGYIKSMGIAEIFLK